MDILATYALGMLNLLLAGVGAYQVLPFGSRTTRIEGFATLVAVTAPSLLLACYALWMRTRWVWGLAFVANLGALVGMLALGFVGGPALVTAVFFFVNLAYLIRRASARR